MWNILKLEVGQLLTTYALNFLFQSMSEEILQRFINDDSPGSNLIEMTELLQRCGGICSDMDTLHLVVQQLVKDKKAVVVQTEKNEQVTLLTLRRRILLRIFQVHKIVFF